MTIISGGTSTDVATIITIPAGKTWKGTLSLACSSDANGIATITVQGGGTGVEPAANTPLLGCTIRIPVLTPNNNSASASDVYIKAGDAAATLRLNKNGVTSVHGSANGTLVN